MTDIAVKQRLREDILGSVNNVSVMFSKGLPQRTGPLLATGTLMWRHELEGRERGGREEKRPGLSMEVEVAGNKQRWKGLAALHAGLLCSSW